MPPEPPQPKSFTGKRALVTAASSGIGKATAQLLADQGADVFITGTSQRTASAAAEINAKGYALADFRQPGAATRAAAEARQALKGGIDILFVSTGGPKPGPFAATDEAEWLTAYHLILGSAIALTQAVLADMPDGGRVIYLTSTAGVVKPLPGLHLSNVMRAGVAALSASLVGEYGPRGITFNVIAPGPINTPRRRQIMEFQAERKQVDLESFEAGELNGIPVRRFAAAEEVAALVAHLASPHAASITGGVHVIDGGLSLT